MNNIRYRSAVCGIFFAALYLLSFRPASAQQAPGNEYRLFQAIFRWVDFKTLFVTHEMPANGPALKSSALMFLPEEWQENSKKHPGTAYEPVMAFHFDRNHDAYLILSPSQLNGKNVNLLVFDSDGHLLATEIVAGDYVYEGDYTTTFGWIRDLDGDHQLDLLMREQQVRLDEDYSQQIYTSDKLTFKVWNGRSFKDDASKNQNRLKQETDEDVGNFRLDDIQRWASDSQSRLSAIQTYEIWIKTYPHNSHVSETKKKLQELKSGKN